VEGIIKKKCSNCWSFSHVFVSRCAVQRM